jgi:hypothetical protein
MERPRPVGLDAASCPHCGELIDLTPLLLVRDLAIVNALLEDLAMRDLASLEGRVGELVERLSRLSLQLSTDLGFYGDDLLDARLAPSSTDERRSDGPRR